MPYARYGWCAAIRGIVVRDLVRHEPYLLVLLSLNCCSLVRPSSSHRVRGKQDNRQVGKPLLDMASYGLHVHAFMFVL